MDRFMMALAAGCLLALGVDAGNDRKQDQQAIQGKWRITERTRRGEQEKVDPGVLLVFTADQWQLLDKGKVDKEGRFSLDAGKKPKTIVVSDSRGENSRYGIYLLERDKLTVCLAPQGKKQAPAEFASTADNGNDLVRLERLKQVGR